MKHRKHLLATLGILGLMAFGLVGLGGSEEELQAANPSLWLSTLATDEGDFPTSLGVEFDPKAEGTGSLGAEAHITYNAGDVSVSSVDFGNCIFDSCIDLSEEGVIKLLGASGKPEDGGKLVTETSRLATIGLTFSTPTTLTFTKCQVINENEELKTCSATNVTVNPGAVCGNTQVEGGETCDDGNSADGDGCSAVCQIEPICGNGATEAPEQCDDGNLADSDGCSAACELESVCGDGLIEGVEQCDDGNAVSEDGCSNICMNEFCSDGVLQLGLDEQCDDGNLADGDGCSMTCQLEGEEAEEEPEEAVPVEPELEEEPEAGPAMLESIDMYPGAGFSSTVNIGSYLQLVTFAFYDDDTGANITTPSDTNSIGYSSNHSFIASVIGDRVIPVNPGNATITATYTEGGITKTDQLNVTVVSGPVCGNGSVESGEQCDDGNAETETCAYGQQSCLVCGATCNEVAGATTYCGDGIQQSDQGETCDDGNSVTEVCEYGAESCAVCNATCQEGPGGVRLCGDGVVQVQDREQCDDGNLIEGDGCDALCQPEAEAPDRDQLAGEPMDTEAELFFEDLPDDLKPAAFENQAAVEREAADKAEILSEMTDSKTQSDAEVDAPENNDQAVSRIDVCRQAYPELDFDSLTADSDGDGLSNRVECYAGTDPNSPDTDADACGDGDEINLLNSDPNADGDCALAPQRVTRVLDSGETVEEVILPKIVLISDPQPGWILPTTRPRVAGVAPVGTTRVTLTAVHADQKTLKALIAGIETLMEAESRDDVQTGIGALNQPLSDAEAFLQHNRDFFDYADFEAGVQAVGEALISLTRDISDEAAGQEADPETEADAPEEEPVAFELQTDLESVLTALRAARRVPVTLGSSLTFSETFIGEGEARRFEFISRNDLEDGKLYNLVAEAEPEDGETLSSAPIRFGVNSGVSIREPVPRSLGTVALNGLSGEVEVQDGRPIVTGDSDFGSHVFAIWNSVVLASSTISDSEQGAFEIQAPKNLDPNVPHRLTLYAVKQEGENKLRSKSVDVFFRIAPTVTASRLPYVIGIGIGILILLTLLLLLGRKLRRKQAPTEIISMPMPESTRPAPVDRESTRPAPVDRESTRPAPVDRESTRPAAGPEKPGDVEPVAETERAEPSAVMPVPAPEVTETPTTTETPETPVPEQTQYQPAIRPLPDPVTEIPQPEGVPEEFDTGEITKEIQPLPPDAVTEPGQEAVTPSPEKPANQPVDREMSEEAMTDNEKRMLEELD